MNLIIMDVDKIKFVLIENVTFAHCSLWELGNIKEKKRRQDKNLAY